MCLFAFTKHDYTFLWFSLLNSINNKIKKYNLGGLNCV